MLTEHKPDRRLIFRERRGGDGPEYNIAAVDCLPNHLFVKIGMSSREGSKPTEIVPGIGRRVGYPEVRLLGVNVQNQLRLGLIVLECFDMPPRPVVVADNRRSVLGNRATVRLIIVLAL